MGAVFRKIASSIIRLAAQFMHQVGGVPYGVCRFHPSCQEYAHEVFQTQPFYKAVGKTLWRIFRCHPFSRGGYDPPAK
jgi:hypothetical protein